MANLSVFHVYVFLGFVSSILFVGQIAGFLGVFQRIPFFPEKECLRLHSELTRGITFTPDEGYETLLLDCRFPSHSSVDVEDLETITTSCGIKSSVLCIFLERSFTTLRYCKNIDTPIDRAYYFDGSTHHSLDVVRTDELISLV